MTVEVRLVRLPHGKGLDLPGYATVGAAGVDLRAAIEDGLTLAPGKRALVPTGFRMALPDGFEGQIRPRSGLAHGHGVTVLNSPGTVDSDYRGEVTVLLVNLSDEPFIVSRGERIAQMVIAPVARAAIAEAREIAGTARGAGGYGSTGRF